MMSVRARDSHWLLPDLLGGLAEAELPAMAVEGLAIDSREVGPGDLYLACAGRRTHGLAHVAEAVQRGAVAVLWEPAAGIEPPQVGVPAWPVPDLSARVGAIAARFFGEPTTALEVIGVTGTDGKTSTVSFLAQALTGLGRRTGVLGTLGYGLYGQLRPGPHTTPDALRVQAEAAAIRSAGGQVLAMEVSSHALDQGRVAAVRFDVAVLTNLSRDHLDYHGDEAAYAAAKRRLFEHGGLQRAVLNVDDAFGRELAARLADSVAVTAYGTDACHLAALPESVEDRLLGTEVTPTPHGLDIAVAGSAGEGHLSTRLFGRFNAGNLLAALAVLLHEGIAFETALNRLARTTTVPGRLERFGDARRQPQVFVDYAHTPRALEQVLRALREHCRGRLWCVFGAGGDRDRGKRPLMGGIAERLADFVVVTDDNPRTEDPTAIVMDILSGMQDPERAYVERDRRQAIALALANSGPGDLVLVAGKGHEAYQIVGDERLPYSDREQVRALLGEGEG